MKDISNKQVNFFEPKIYDSNKNFEILKRKLVLNSFRIYIVVSVISLSITSILTLKNNLKYNYLKNNISQIEEYKIENINLKATLLKQQELSHFLDDFNQNKKNNSIFIQTLYNLKSNDIEIKKISLKDNNIILECNSKDSNSAINYIKKIRNNSIFLDTNYSGGNYLNNKFEFELNIKI